MTSLSYRDMKTLTLCPGIVLRAVLVKTVAPGDAVMLVALFVSMSLGGERMFELLEMSCYNGILRW